MDTELRNMVMAFRVTELQNLLGHFNKNKNGRKNELQARALELVKVNNSVIVAKIRDLYRSIQLSLNQPLPASAVLAHNQQFSNAMTPGRAFGSSTAIQSGDKVMYQTRYGNTFGQLPGLQIISHNHNSRVPICPDVHMRPLPFYDVLAQLTRPTSLLSTTSTGRAHEANFTFFLTPSQAGDIASSKEFNNNLNDCKVQYTTQVQIRFCALETGSPQDDLFPPSMQVKVNNRSVPLPHPIPSNRPGVEPKRPSRPLNVTNFVKNSPTVTNNVNVTWASDNTTRDYVISITLVKKLVSQDLLNRLKAKGPRPADYTRGMVKEMVRRDDADCIASSTFKVSVACPLGKCRMSLPCRASTCKHLQCFDANLYLQMNEKKPVWSCPVCDKFTAFEDLAIDGYFQDVITKLCKSNEDGNEIEVMQDGSWAPLQVKKDPDEPPAKVKSVVKKERKRIRRKRADVEIESETRLKPCKMEDTICLDDDDVAVICDEPAKKAAAPSTAAVEKPTGPAEVIDLTFTSDEDENSKDEGNASSSTSKSEAEEEESEEEVVQPSVKRKKASYVIQDSSSSENTPVSSPATAAPPPAPKISSSTTSATVARPPSSPDCITLDSPSPSPPPTNSRKESLRPTEGRKHSVGPASKTNPPRPPSATSGGGMPGGAVSTASSFSTDNILGSSSSITFNSMPLYGTPGVTPTSGLGGPSASDASYHPQNPFASYPTWDNSTAFPSTTDFSSLDFPSMDYFNRGSTSFNPTNQGPARRGNGPGFGGSGYY